MRLDSMGVGALVEEMVRLGQLSGRSRLGFFSCRWTRTVLRSRPVWRAMAEIDHPRLNSAWISTSSYF